MRNYAKAVGTFWTGETGRKIRVLGRDVQVMAFYLFTCPSSNWLGLYYLPIPTICHEVGSSSEGALEALRSLEKLDFAYYDEETETVWVPGAAKFQIAESLDPKDNKIKGIVSDLQLCECKRFAEDFYRRYKDSYNLPEIDFKKKKRKPLTSPLQAPPKPRTGTRTGTRTGSGAQLLARSEQSSPSPGSIFTELPCTGKSRIFEVTKDYIDEMRPLYPNVDIEKETLLAKGWLINNPKQQKTYDGMTRFLGSWYARQQNKPAGGQGNGSSPANNKPAGVERPKYVAKERDENGLPLLPGPDMDPGGG